MPGVGRRFDEIVRMLKELHGDVSKNNNNNNNNSNLHQFHGIQKVLNDQNERASKRHRETAVTMAGVLQQGAYYINKTMVATDVTEQFAELGVEWSRHGYQGAE